MPTGRWHGNFQKHYSRFFKQLRCFVNLALLLALPFFIAIIGSNCNDCDIMNNIDMF